LHAKGQKAARIIVVTSSVPEEGKSVFAAAFARSLLEAGRSLLIIDGDLRRPRISEIMGIKSGPGLQDVMARRVSVEEAICKDMNNRLHVLPAGHCLEGEEDAIEPEKV